MKSRTSHKNSGKLELTSLIVISLFIANWLVTPFLFQLHEHIWCAEHQSFEHPHHDEQHHENNPQQDYKSGIVSHYQSEVSIHEHELCHVLDQLNSKTNLELIFEVLSDTPFIANIGNAFNAVYIAENLYETAPKNSPPTV